MNSGSFCRSIYNLRLNIITKYKRRDFNKKNEDFVISIKIKDKMNKDKMNKDKIENENKKDIIVPFNKIIAKCSNNVNFDEYLHQEEEFKNTKCKFLDLDYFDNGDFIL